MADEELDRAILINLGDWVGRDRALNVLTLHRATTADTLTRLSALAESPDRQALRALAHLMAGGAATIGLSALAGHALEVEQLALTGPESTLFDLARELRRHLIVADEALARAVAELYDAATDTPDLVNPRR